MVSEFFYGLFIGGSLGLMIAALCNIAARNNRDDEDIDR